ncbi:hypothetical protein B0O80DRAFT_169096 [Mortierella sp. GBAus27b]|nr:hypothetical protein B0O80DRAFT_169096 [Mortierella sp. GBAus27b]
MNFQVFCLLDGSSLSTAFKIKVSPNDAVSDLKRTVKQVIAPKLDNVSVCDIQLWRVSIPLQGSSITTAVFLDPISSKRHLAPNDRLSQDDSSEEFRHLSYQPE